MSTLVFFNSDFSIAHCQVFGTTSLKIALLFLPPTLTTFRRQFGLESTAMFGAIHARSTQDSYLGSTSSQEGERRRRRRMGGSGTSHGHRTCPLSTQKDTGGWWPKKESQEFVRKFENYDDKGIIYLMMLFLCLMPVALVVPCFGGLHADTYQYSPRERYAPCILGCPSFLSLLQSNIRLLREKERCTRLGQWIGYPQLQLCPQTEAGATPDSKHTVRFQGLLNSPTNFYF